MKWIYVGMANDDIIAFHDKKDIMSRYLRNYKDSNPTDIVRMCRLKRNNAKRYQHYDEYWLVSCNDTYVQTLYEDTLLSITPDFIEKKELIKKLNHLLDTTKKESDKLVLIETIRIIEYNKKRCGTYTPSLTLLNEEYWRIQSYKDRLYYNL